MLIFMQCEFTTDSAKICQMTTAFEHARVLKSHLKGDIHTLSIV